MTVNETNVREEIVCQKIQSLPLRASPGISDTPIGQVSTPHYHDEMEFLPVTQGVFTFNCCGERHDVPAGNVIFFNARVPHSTECYTRGTRTGLIQFRQKDFLPMDETAVMRYSVRFYNSTEEPFRILNDPEIFATSNRIIDEASRIRAGSDLILRGDVLRLIGLLIRQGILTDPHDLYRRKEVGKILPALTYFHDHFDEEISLDDVSGRLGFDPSYFCRLFKEATGATPIEYLNYVRICKAEKMLNATSDSVLEISNNVGFSSVSYFNRVFKRFTGMSPRQFRSMKYINM